MIAELQDVLRTPYLLGGRQVGIGLDCLGVVAEVARRRGIPPPDGWPSIRSAWEQGQVDTSTGFPAGWCRMPPGTTAVDGDVLLLWTGMHPWCAIVHEGLVVSAHPDSGPYAMPLWRWRQPVSELWRFR
jgi:hypothetical protein